MSKPVKNRNFVGSDGRSFLDDPDKDTWEAGVKASEKPWRPSSWKMQQHAQEQLAGAPFDGYKYDEDDPDDWELYREVTAVRRAIAAQSSEIPMWYDDSNVQIYDHPDRRALGRQGPPMRSPSPPQPRSMPLPSPPQPRPMPLPSRLDPSRPWTNFDPHKGSPSGAHTSRTGPSSYYGMAGHEFRGMAPLNAGKRPYSNISTGSKGKNPFVLDLDFANLSLS